MSESKGIAYCQGQYLPIEEASVPILDPAFHKSDVVFDAVTVCGQRVLPPRRSYGPFLRLV